MDLPQEAYNVFFALTEEFEHCHFDSFIVVGEENLQATIGYGHAIPKAEHPKHITDKEAAALLASDTADRWKALQSEIVPAVLSQLTNNQLGALLSFRYNVKGGLWLSSSTRKLLNSGDIKGFPAKLMLWNKGEGGVVKMGLTRRRACECFLWEGGTLSQLKSKSFLYQKYH